MQPRLFFPRGSRPLHTKAYTPKKGTMYMSIRKVDDSDASRVIRRRIALRKSRGVIILRGPTLYSTRWFFVSWDVCLDVRREAKPICTYFASFLFAGFWIYRVVYTCERKHIYVHRLFKRLSNRARAVHHSRPRFIHSLSLSHIIYRKLHHYASPTKIYS